MIRDLRFTFSGSRVEMSMGFRSYSLGRHAIVAATLLLAIGAAGAQSAPVRTHASPERAVAEFYAWYTPMALHDPGPDMRALRERPALFSPAIVRALRADSVATAQGGEEIDGLDGDPFLNAQDPCERYRPIRTRRASDVYLVEVLGSGGCEIHRTPDVIVQVTFRDGSPVFTNFLYSRKRGDDLLSLLKRLTEQRRRADQER